MILLLDIYVFILAKIEVFLVAINSLIGNLTILIIFSSVSEQLDTELLEHVSNIKSLHIFATASSIFSSTGLITGTDSFRYIKTLSFDDLIRKLLTNYRMDGLSFLNNSPFITSTNGYCLSDYIIPSSC